MAEGALSWLVDRGHMETFAPPRPLIESPRYERDRRRAIAALRPGSIDAPIVDLIGNLARLSHCFTLQSCFGHFLHGEDPEERSLRTLPPEGGGAVRYRMAYLALCIENGPRGAALLEKLRGIPRIDPTRVQLGSPGWFLKRHPNVYALQVMPAAQRSRDEAVLDYGEALRIQAVRDAFFAALEELVAGEIGERGPGHGP